MSYDEIAALREALRLSPQNVKLRLVIAAKLYTMREYEQAEAEYRAALRHEPKNTAILHGLAKTFYRQGKFSETLVITEQLVEGDSAAVYFLLHAKVLIKTGQISAAQQYYRRAVEAAPELEDEELSRVLGFRKEDFVAEPDEPAYDDPLTAPLNDFLDAPQEVATEAPTISFEQVGGMDQVKEAIRMKIIYPLQNKEMFAAYGKKIGGGVLLYGPPGCGKTLLARATAGEIRAKFLSVGLHEILDMYIGNSEKQLHSIFETARENSPCVLFFDEVDALAARRSDMRQSAGRHIINQFLSEMDGANGDNDGVLILAATNAPWHVDSAFRRPGRFDRIQFVPPPDVKAREAIFRIHLEGKPVETLNFAKLAAACKGFSGADIRAAVESCVEDVLTEAMRKGKMLPLTQNAMLAAIKKTKSSTAEWFSSAKNYATYANESGVYDDILDYLKSKRGD